MPAPAASRSRRSCARACMRATTRTWRSRGGSTRASATPRARASPAPRGRARAHVRTGSRRTRWFPSRTRCWREAAAPPRLARARSLVERRGRDDPLARQVLDPRGHAGLVRRRTGDDDELVDARRSVALEVGGAGGLRERRDDDLERCRIALPARELRAEESAPTTAPRRKVSP